MEQYVIKGGKPLKGEVEIQVRDRKTGKIFITEKSSMSFFLRKFAPEFGSKKLFLINFIHSLN